MKTLRLIALSLAAMACSAFAQDVETVYTAFGHYTGSSEYLKVVAYSDGMISIKNWAGAKGYDFNFYPDIPNQKITFPEEYYYDGIFYVIPRDEERTASINLKKAYIQGYANDGTLWVSFKDEETNNQYLFIWNNPKHFNPNPNSPVVFSTWGKWSFEDPRFSYFDMQKQIVRREDGSYTIFQFFNTDADMSFWVNEYDEVAFPSSYDATTEYTYLDFGEGETDYLFVQTGKLGERKALFEKNEDTGECKITFFENNWTVVNGEGSHIYFTWSESTGIDTPAIEDNGVVEYYDLQGRKLTAEPTHGLYLRRTGKKVEKIIR